MGSRVFVIAAVIASAAMAPGCAEQPVPLRAGPPPPAPSASEGAGIPGEVRALLERRCAGCHVAGPRDAAGWGSVLDLPRMVEARIVVPGNPHASPLIGQLLVGEMPRRGPRLRAREVELLESWIRGLAPLALAPLE
jgi:mono/diheme cytochrome c family protein